jgi:hypothetical protein
MPNQKDGNASAAMSMGELIRDIAGVGQGQATTRLSTGQRIPVLGDMVACSACHTTGVDPTSLEEGVPACCKPCGGVGYIKPAFGPSTWSAPRDEGRVTRRSAK